METGVIFYELDYPYIYEDSMNRNFYVVVAEPRVRIYVLHNHSFQHPINTSHFNPDAPYGFSLSWLHPDAAHHPFPNGPIHHLGVFAVQF
ncbi:hypothetical protein AHAS_Ahas09G0193600 [Arachis hypogaea]